MYDKVEIFTRKSIVNPQTIFEYSHKGPQVSVIWEVRGWNIPDRDIYLQVPRFVLSAVDCNFIWHNWLIKKISVKITTVNDKDRFYTATKIPKCHLKRENYLQQKMKLSHFQVSRESKMHLKGEENLTCLNQIVQIYQVMTTPRKSKNWLSNRTMWPCHIYSR